jgi:hypothetical protein
MLSFQVELLASRSAFGLALASPMLFAALSRTAASTATSRFATNPFITCVNTPTINFIASVSHLLYFLNTYFASFAAERGSNQVASFANVEGVSGAPISVSGSAEIQLQQHHRCN